MLENYVEEREGNEGEGGEGVVPDFQVCQMTSIFASALPLRNMTSENNSRLYCGS